MSGQIFVHFASIPPKRGPTEAHKHLTCGGNGTPKVILDTARTKKAVDVYRA